MALCIAMGVDQDKLLADTLAASISSCKSRSHLPCGFSFHWSDLHRMLFDSLPEGTVRFGHNVVSYQCSGDKVVITAEASSESEQTQEVSFTADLLVAADGSNSTVRKIMHPADKRRYRL